MCHNLNIPLLLAAGKVRNDKEDNYLLKKEDLSPKEKILRLCKLFVLCNPEVLAILCPFTGEALKKLDTTNNITSAVEPCEVFHFNIN